MVTKHTGMESEGWGPNAVVRVHLTEYGLNQFAYVLGWLPNQIYEVSFWVAMAQLGKLMEAGKPSVFTKIELVKNCVA